jgi:hypothetical protein
MRKVALLLIALMIILPNCGTTTVAQSPTPSPSPSPLPSPSPTKEAFNIAWIAYYLGLTESAVNTYGSAYYGADWVNVDKPASSNQQYITSLKTLYSAYYAVKNAHVQADLGIEKLDMVYSQVLSAIAKLKDVSGLLDNWPSSGSPDMLKILTNYKGDVGHSIEQLSLVKERIEDYRSLSKSY